MVGEEGGKALGGSDWDQHAGGFLSEELVFTSMHITMFGAQ